MEKIELLKRVIEIQKRYFRRVKYSAESLEKIADVIEKHISSNESQDIDKVIINYFKASILKSIDNSKRLKSIYFDPYKSIYDSVNTMFNITSDSDTFKVFIESVLDVKSSSDKEFLKKEIFARYQLKINNIPSVSYENELLKKIRTIPNLAHITEKKLLNGLEILKEKSSNYYTVIISKHGTNLNENNQLGEAQEMFYELAIKELIEILNDQLSDNMILPKEEKVSTIKEGTKKSENQSLFQKIKADEEYEDISDDEIIEALEKLKVSNPKYYEIIIKRHGESLKEWNTLSKKEQPYYTKAIEKLKKILNSSKSKKTTTLFQKIKSYEEYKNVSDEEIIEALEKLKASNPKYYKIIIKRHGNTLNEWNSLGDEENIIYSNAIKKLKKLLSNKTEKKIALFSENRDVEEQNNINDETLKKQKLMLEKLQQNRKKEIESNYFLKSILEDIKALEILDVSIKYNLSIQEICEILFANIFYFDNIPSVINKIGIASPDLYQYLVSFVFSWIKELNDENLKNEFKRILNP